MAVEPQLVMRILGHRGIDVRLQDGNLIARWKFGPMPPDMVPYIRRFKQIIMAELKHDDHERDVAA